MVTKAFAVFDSKAGNFGVPFFTAVTAVAVRMFTDLILDNTSTVSRHPEDFSLFEIGSFDDVKGVLMPLGIPINLGLASVFVSSVSPKQVRVNRPPMGGV